MLKSIFFKEWLKTRWVFIISAVLFFLVILRIFLSVSYGIRFIEAKNYWYQTIIMQKMFFTDLSFWPVLAGLALSAAQFVPEMNSSRLKLTLHLPMPEKKIIFEMVLIGTVLLTGEFLIAVIGIAVISSYFFPKEVLSASLLTIYPWTLAGFVTYWAGAMVFVEPIWFKRIVLMFTSALYVQFLLNSKMFLMYEQSILLFTLLSLMFVTGVIYTGMRFKKGAMK
jgi:hypothetical protein